jgi:Protein of unknown function (DUF2950)
LLSVVASPAAWGDTGVMTFIISHAGKLYQRDMGKSSAAIGAAMTTYNPGPG